MYELFVCLYVDMNFSYVIAYVYVYELFVCSYVDMNCSYVYSVCVCGHELFVCSLCGHEFVRMCSPHPHERYDEEEELVNMRDTYIFML